MQPTTRLYANAHDAEAAAAELKKYGFHDSDIHVVSPPAHAEAGEAGETQAAPSSDIVASIEHAGVRRGADAHAYAGRVQAGATLVTVHTVFGAGLLATRILDEHRPMESHVTTDHGHVLAHDPAPLSSALGLKLLSHDPTPLSTLLGLTVLTKGRASASAAAGMPELSSEPAPLSHAVKLPLLSATPAPFSGAVHMPVLSGKAAPLSNAVKLPVLSGEAAPFSKKLGWKTLSDEPAPLSKLLNLPVLLRRDR